MATQTNKKHSGQERRNHTFSNSFPWNQFLAELDLKVIKVGVAFNVCTWQSLRSFSGDIFHRLYLPRSGKFRILYPDGECLIEPGNLYLLPCNTPLKHEGITPSDFYWVHFISKRLAMIPMLSYPMVVTIDSPDAEYLLMEETIETMRECGDFTSAVKIKNNIMQLLAPFLNRISDPLPCQNEIGRFLKVVEYIDLQIDRNDIEIAELSSLAGMSRTLFSSSFRKIFGMPPKHYICIRRLFHAKQMLLETKLPIKDIAARCGYHDEFFFHRIFKKYVNVPPGRYRKYSVY